MKNAIVCYVMPRDSYNRCFRGTWVLTRATLRIIPGDGILLNVVLCLTVTKNDCSQECEIVYRVRSC
jgi:hypothetical protein